MSLLETIAKDLNVPQDMLSDALSGSRRLVKHIKIPKKNGSFRLVFQPSKKLKVIQYWLNNHIFKKLNIHESATAYQKEKSIKINATTHKNGQYFLKLDFKDFFPSIKFKDFSPYIKEWNNSISQPFKEKELLEIVKRSCFYTGDLLPIGYPTSPIISNIVMYNFDSKITSLLSDKDNYGMTVYTRYADDLTFSTNLKGACKKIEILVSKELKSMLNPKLTLNQSKTRYVSSSGGSAFITGLRICHDGHITIHREYKDKVRLLITLYQKNKLPEEDINSLKGHLSYIKDVDGSFYTKLQKKHFSTINTLLNQN